MLGIAAVGVSLGAWLAKHPRTSTSEESTVTCAEQVRLEHDAIWAPGYATVSQLVDDSTAVVFGVLSKRNAPGPAPVQVRADRIIKGDKRLLGAVLPICYDLALTNDWYPKMPLNVVVFMGGRDGTDWVPIEGSNGIVAVSDTGTVDLSGLVLPTPSPVKLSDLR
ncbi:hypothetical protein BMG523Draft_00717 [Frankia sp. BMG5.23]|nr:hypothetical protein BMG523Draft_00717 [Frankia sp. BMG5.23]